MKNNKVYHRPVMLEATIRELNIKPNGVYVDLTFGGGGHTKAILERLDKGSLFAFDQDPAAKAEAHGIQDQRLCFIEGNFRFFTQFLHASGIEAVDGILADLGTSSHQLDNSQRGFAARLDGPLDMRMHQEEGTTAATILNTYSQAELTHILRAYGNLTAANRMADHIVARRSKKPLQTIADLKAAIAPCLPKGREYKFFAKTFQALRMVVNDELGALCEMLNQTPSILAHGGRFVVLSYHSGEDRPVKNFMKTGDVNGDLIQDFYGNIIRPMIPVYHRPLMPSQDEIAQNNRARSARLRVATRA